MKTNHKMNMPKRYADLSEDEMEYDGGWLNFVAGIVCSVISVTHTVIAATTNNKTIAQAATVIGLATTAVSLALGTGVVTTVLKGAVSASTCNMASAAYLATVTPMETALTSTATACKWPF